ncbi:RNA-binding S4 domain-containing protein [Agrilactobacillus yilanensis]|uniref:RQC P-site tRNA stabilizing factor n=1 Tax=Agrilactobacillus yilanensis TaxID=2485997 RepID=A0ABW4J3S8_9LACO|nr:RNA-binding S4 domain-containing protein [Agrilactobacillus yilanensis]
MRLDKFLKVSRVIKRRSVAKEIADKGRILVNGKVAKSATDVAVGDKLEIKFGNRTTVIEVKNLLDSTKKEDAAEMYVILSEEFAQKDNFI